MLLWFRFWESSIKTTIELRLVNRCFANSYHLPQVLPESEQPHMIRQPLGKFVAPTSAIIDDRVLFF